MPQGSGQQNWLRNCLIRDILNQKNKYSLFLKKSGSHRTIVALYVDDIIIIGSEKSTITSLKSYLHQTFSIKDLGLVNYFLGIEVGYEHGGIILSQHKFTKELLHDCTYDLSSKP